MIMKNRSKWILGILTGMTLASCGLVTSSSENIPSSESLPSTSEDIASEHSSEISSSELLSSESIPSSVESSEPYVGPEEDHMTPKQRVARVASLDPDVPSNVTDEASFKRLGTANLRHEGGTYSITHGNLTLNFIQGADGYEISVNQGTTAMFDIVRPAKFFVRYENESGSKKTKTLEGCYSEVKLTDYGISAKVTLLCPGGTMLDVEDKYYIPTLEVSEEINVERNIEVLNAQKKDIGFQSIYALQTKDNGLSNMEYFVPNSVFGTFTNPSSTQKYQYYRETAIGMPIVMMRNSQTGYTAALARYQPVIDYSTDSYAAVSIHNGETSSGDAHASIEITYPSRDSARHYFSYTKMQRVVYKMSIHGFIASKYEDAMIKSYNGQFHLQDQRILDPDIDEIYGMINRDFKSFLRSNYRNGITSYGLPWTVTIENGNFGGMSYQAGFVGQQIPDAYHMILYGIKNNDNVSLQNGINVINFWVSGANMMSDAGVPMIWYDGGSNRWAGYPTFIRMAADSMEGLLDAYRVCEVHGKATAAARASWIEAVTAAAEWMLRAQNSDGSWYRCYNYNGTYYDPNNESSGVTWNPGDICRSTSKNNATMPVRFLGKMYEMTGDQRYLNAIKKAGDFIMQNLYPKHYYNGGTCDNPDAVDREAGVFAMYAFDTLYMLTGEARYLEALEEATVFTMSTVIVPSFKINPTCTELKAANPAKYGYSDGLSFICCNVMGVDNFAAFAYYELFRTYILTGKRVYFEMAEFLQQNTKGAMDYDGIMDFPYPSLVAEATTICTFGFSSAKDGNGVEGVWLPWCSDANADPIARMYDHFGVADVGEFRNTSLEELRSSLNTFGIGGHAHRHF